MHSNTYTHSLSATSSIHPSTPPLHTHSFSSSLILLFNFSLLYILLFLHSPPSHIFYVFICFLRLCFILVSNSPKCCPKILSLSLMFNLVLLSVFYMLRLHVSLCCYTLISPPWDNKEMFSSFILLIRCQLQSLPTLGVHCTVYTWTTGVP